MTMFMCPSCRRRWTDENAEANGRRCYRACDTPLVHMEEEAGYHLNYLPEIVLGPESGFDNLREAVLAVEPNGKIGVPPARHTEPLVLDKPMTIGRTGSGTAEVFLEIDAAPAIRVSRNTEQKDPTWSQPVILENLTIFRGGARDGLPLIFVESGEMVLTNCRLDCRRGPGILVKEGARLRLENCLVVEPGNYGVHCEDGATLETVGGEFVGGQGHVFPVVPAEESGSAPLARGSAVSSADGAAVSLTGTRLRGFRVGLALKGCGGSAVKLEIQGCEHAVLLQDPNSFQMEECTLSGDEGDILTARGGKCRLTGCSFTSGKVQVTAAGCIIEVDDTTFERSAHIACLIEDRTEAEVRDCKFLSSEGNGLVVSKGAACLVHQSSFSSVAGVGFLALAGAEPEMEGCTISGSGVGICVLPKAVPQIRNTEIKGSLGSGVLLQPGALGVYESVSIEGSGADQFVVGRCEDTVELMKCTISRGDHGGVRLVDGARALLRHNTIEGNSGDGISIGDNARIHLDETTITGCGSHGLLLGPLAKAKLEDCTLNANKACGIRSFEASSVQTSRCTFNGNGLAGLFLDRTTRLNCEDTKITGCGGPGIVLSGQKGQDEENQTELQRCTLEGNAGEGILGMGAGQAKLIQCVIANNEGAGFRVWGSFRLDIEGGTCRRENGPPSRIGRGATGTIQGCRFEGGTSQLVLSGKGQAMLANNHWPASRWRSVKPWLVARIRQPR